MVKILRITGIAAVVLAGAILVFPLIFGIRSDPKAKEFLKSIDATEKFTKSQANRPAKTDIKASPLVTQAQNFGLFLNPPKPQPKPEEVQAQLRPAVVAPKFTLIGTSIFPDHPEKSFALIDEPGKGLHWIKQAAKIGYITVQQIKSGAIVISDGSKTSEITAERPAKVSLLRKPPAGKNAQPGPQAAPLAAQQPEPLGPERQEKLGELAKALQAVEQEVSAGKLDPNAAAERTSQIMEKYQADIQAKRTRISSEEANNLGQLGSLLQAQQDSNAQKSQIKDLNITQSVSDKTGSAPQPRPVPHPRNLTRRRVTKNPNTPPPAAAPQQDKSTDSQQN